MQEVITEKDAYDMYVEACHSKIGEFVSEFNFMEWRASGRPKSQYHKDGYWGSIVFPLIKV